MRKGILSTGLAKSLVWTKRVSTSTLSPRRESLRNRNSKASEAPGAKMTVFPPDKALTAVEDWNLALSGRGGAPVSHSSFRSIHLRSFFKVATETTRKGELPWLRISARTVVSCRSDPMMKSISDASAFTEAAKSVVPAVSSTGYSSHRRRSRKAPDLSVTRTVRYCSGIANDRVKVSPSAESAAW